MTTPSGRRSAKGGFDSGRKIQRLGAVANNEVLIDLDVRETSEKALDQGKVQIINALETNAPAGKLDLNNTSSLTFANYLLEKDPLRAGTDAEPALHGRRPRPSSITATRPRAGC